MSPPRQTVRPHRRWRVLPLAPAQALADTPFPPLIRHLLYHRGVRSPDQAARFLFLEPWPESDPLWLPGIERAVERLAAAIEGGETIAVFGDFDVDGLTAAALLTQALQELGATVLPYVPHRFSEGYGLNVGAIDVLHQRGASLLVAADCGTSSVAEIEHACRVGMDTLVLDHHSIPSALPPASALVNPRLGPPDSPFAELASVGVAFHTMAALHQSLSAQPWKPHRFLDLVAIGTVADVAPLVGENRRLVKEGLAAIADAGRPGLRALIEVAGLQPGGIDTEAIGYGLAPRLNAAGRLAHAELSLRLLLTQNEAEAIEIAHQLDALNRERQRQTEEALALAADLLASEDAGAPLIFIGHPDISEGIVGLVAGKLAEKHYRPTVVYQLGESEGRGSCRSIPEFDIVGALRRQEHLLVRYGGHHAAAGFTAANRQLSALKAGMLEHAAAELAGVEVSPTLEIDAELPLGSLRGEEIRWLQCLRPYGPGNPQPTLLSRQVLVSESRPVGSDGQHLRLKLKDGSVTWPAIGFNLGDRRAEPGRRTDMVYSLTAGRQGEDTLELRIHDLAPA